MAVVEEENHSSSADSAIDANGGDEEEEDDHDEKVAEVADLVLAPVPRRPLSRSNSYVGAESAAVSATALVLETGRSTFGRRLFGSGMMAYSNRSSSVADLVQGYGELDAMDSASVVAAENWEDAEDDEGADGRPYLLLDVRSEEEFDRGHLRTAQSYPQSRLLRCMSFETRSMLRFKNKPKKIIVLYDNDETIASK